MSNKKIAILFMVFVSICWAPTFSVAKNLFDSIGANSLTCIRFLIGTVVVLIAKKLVKNQQIIKKEDYKALGVSIFCCAGHYLLSNLASMRLDESESIVFSSFQALVTLIVASLILNQIVKPNVCFYVGVASIGAVLTMRIDPLYTGAVLGYIFMFGATIIWSVYCVIMTRLLLKYRITTLIFYQLLGVTLLTLPFLLIEKHNFSALTVKDILFLLFISIIGVGVCYFFNAFSLKKIGAISSAMFMNIGPIIFTLTSMKIVQVNITDIIGIVMILIGIILTMYTMFKKGNQIKHR